jgi:hypothetical protein
MADSMPRKKVEAGQLLAFRVDESEANELNAWIALQEVPPKPMGAAHHFFRLGLMLGRMKNELDSKTEKTD